jgi:hypothetical protein
MAARAKRAAGEHVRGDVLRQAFYGALEAADLGHLREQEQRISN